MVYVTFIMVGNCYLLTFKPKTKTFNVFLFLTVQVWLLEPPKPTRARTMLQREVLCSTVHGALANRTVTPLNSIQKSQGDRSTQLNNKLYQIDFKSHQWFGATVRSHGDTILACAPLYYWRTKKDETHSDATGTCYLSVQNFTKFVEYAPCRTEVSGPEGQGYCQGGFSADFTMDGRVVLGGPGSYFWQGQVISAATEDIIKSYYPGYFMQGVKGEVQTKHVWAVHDDSYQGYSVAVGEFSGDQVEDFVTGVPKRLLLHGLVSILNGSDLTTLMDLTGEQVS
ncbi:hypothetical protein XENOCAPTIV_008472 [Xenoophorus captivus]|uniref:Uncharacterized protein n=1 Tax=Xenoophorus captivus TaxID=1517983 RepID=A0ABV0RGF5_9TELE